MVASSAPSSLGGELSVVHWPVLAFRGFARLSCRLVCSSKAARAREIASNRSAWSPAGRRLTGPDGGAVNSGGRDNGGPLFWRRHRRSFASGALQSGAHFGRLRFPRAAPPRAGQSCSNKRPPMMDSRPPAGLCGRRPVRGGHFWPKAAGQRQSAVHTQSAARRLSAGECASCSRLCARWTVCGAHTARPAHQHCTALRGPIVCAWVLAQGSRPLMVPLEC